MAVVNRYRVRCDPNSKRGQPRWYIYDSMQLQIVGPRLRKKLEASKLASALSNGKEDSHDQQGNQTTESF